jgi:hypothetical protein
MHILAFEGDSHVEWFEGSFPDCLEDKKRRLGADSVEPRETVDDNDGNNALTIAFKPIQRTDGGILSSGRK